jgi:hypothetical protein
MTFRKIHAEMTDKQAHTLKKPSLFRACVNGDKAEYIEVEKKLMAEYRKVNKIGDNDE